MKAQNAGTARSANNGHERLLNRLRIDESQQRYDGLIKHCREVLQNIGANQNIPSSNLARAQSGKLYQEAYESMKTLLDTIQQQLLPKVINTLHDVSSACNLKNEMFKKIEAHTLDKNNQGILYEFLDRLVIGPSSFFNIAYELISDSETLNIMTEISIEDKKQMMQSLTQEDLKSKSSIKAALDIIENVSNHMEQASKKTHVFASSLVNPILQKTKPEFVRQGKDCASNYHKIIEDDRAILVKLKKILDQCMDDLFIKGYIMLLPNTIITDITPTVTSAVTNPPTQTTFVQKLGDRNTNSASRGI